MKKEKRRIMLMCPNNYGQILRQKTGKEKTSKAGRKRQEDRPTQPHSEK